MHLLLAALLACTHAERDSTDKADTGDTDVEPLCQDGLPTRGWEDASGDQGFMDIAGDIEVMTEEGAVALSELWDGCDVFLFLQDNPRQADSTQWPYHLWERDVEAFFDALPANTVLFLGSNDLDEGVREEALALVGSQVEAALGSMDEEIAERWRGRIHTVAGRYQEEDGWLGSLMRSPRWGVVLDREQRIRFVGSYADQTRYSASVGWFEPNLSMAANEVVYANFLAERAHRMAGQEVSTFRLWDVEPISDAGWAGARGETTVELPDAATMAEFDTLELDLDMGCVGDGEYGDCPAWDYLVYLYLCDEDDPDTEEDESEVCNAEFGRWISTYHREGRYVHDVTPLMPLLATGGTRKFQFYTQQEYEITMDLRFRTEGLGERPVEVVPLFTGGSFDEGYNDRYEELEIPIPEGASRAELATVISGHGQVSPGNCAEFCVTEHIFTVNGHQNIRELDDAGTSQGCMDKVGQGVVPNQYGTWWYGRSGWCPGWEVPMERFDVTDQVTPGATATVSYQGLRNGVPYTAGGAHIVLSSWLIFYE